MGTASLMTCMTVGVRNMQTQTLLCCSGSQPVSAPKEARARGQRNSGSLFRCTTVKGSHQARARRNLSLLQTHTCWYAQQREAYPAGERAGLRPGTRADITLYKRKEKKKKHHNTWLCSPLWLRLVDWLQGNQYLLITATLGGHNLCCSWLVIILS